MKKCPKCGKKNLIMSIFGSVCSNCFYDPKEYGEHLCHCGKILEIYKKDKHSFYCKDHPKQILSVG